MRQAKPAMLADPDRVFTPQLTQDPAKALRFTSRTGTYKFIARHKGMDKQFWYRRIDRLPVGRKH